MHVSVPVPAAPANPPARTTVAILLSIYDGEKYLQAQLDSIGAQTHRDWVLLWRDDGSSDGGRGIMQRFAEAVGHDRCIELADTQRHIGATRSFLTLLHAASDYPLISFCDQDDVWLAEKLERAVAHVRTVPAEVPALYCARKFVGGCGPSAAACIAAGAPAAAIFRCPGGKYRKRLHGCAEPHGCWLDRCDQPA